MTFADLAWSHYWWQAERERNPLGEVESERAYVAKLRQFEEVHGDVVHAYWSTHAASAVALTDKPLAGRRWDLSRVLKLGHEDCELRIHRLTDWLMHESDLADLLQQCDVLAIKVSEQLRGGSERIAMRWLVGVMEHVVGFVERTGGESTPEQRAALIKAQKAELRRIEDFYLRTGGQAGRIVYFTGMLIGTAIVALLAGVAAIALWFAGAFDGASADELGTIFLCGTAGAVGSLVSVMSRLRPGGKFTLDFEVGRPLVRRLGVFRPAVGAVFGVLTYGLLESGLLVVDPRAAEFPGAAAAYFGVAAFIAGFSERWVHVVIGGAKKTIGGDDEPDEKPR